MNTYIIIAIVLSCCCISSSSGAFLMLQSSNKTQTPTQMQSSNQTPTQMQSSNQAPTTTTRAPTTARTTTTTQAPTTTEVTTTPAPTSVTVYEHNNYQGRSLNIGLGVTSYDHLSGQNFNDIISSVKVPQGLNVMLYEHAGQQGAIKTLTSDTPSLDDFNDKTSSILVQRQADIDEAMKKLFGGLFR